MMLPGSMTYSWAGADVRIRTAMAEGNKDQFLEVKNPLLYTEGPCRGLTYLCEQGACWREKPVQSEVRIRHFQANARSEKAENEAVEGKAGSATSCRQ